jgi:hypothetical protein
VRLGPFAECAGGAHAVTLDSLLAQLGRSAPRRAILVTDAAVAAGHGVGREPSSPLADYVCGSTSAISGFRLVAGVTRSLSDGWTRRLAARGIRLLGIYPRLTAVVAAPTAGRLRERAVVHLDGAMLGCFHVREGIVRYARILVLSDGTGPDDACKATAALLPRGEIYVCGEGPAANDLAARLAHTREAILLDPCPAAPGSGWAPLLGAARHALGAAPADAVPRIPPGRAPRPRALSPLRWLAARAAGH